MDPIKTNWRHHKLNHLYPDSTLLLISVVSYLWFKLSFTRKISIFFLIFFVEISMYLQNFARPPLVSPRNDVWGTSAKIPYWWCVITQIWVEPLIGWKFSSASQKHYPDMSVVICHMRSFLRRHFAGKPVMASQHVSCFHRLKLRLHIIFVEKKTKLNKKQTNSWIPVCSNDRLSWPMHNGVHEIKVLEINKT